MSLDEPIFHRDSELFVPTQQAIGPWAPDQLHGGGPAGLIGRAFQELAPEMQVARTGFAFLGPVPAQPLTLTAQITKPGKRLQLARAEISAGGRVYLTADATLLRRGEIEVPEAGRWEAEPPAPGPHDPSLHPQRADAPPAFHTTGMTIRFANGTSFSRIGPAQGWFGLERELVAGESIPPVSRALAASDFGNGASRVLDWDHWLFVNCDLTVTLLRDPVGIWILLDSVTRIDATGVGWASSTLYDEQGPIGFAQQTLFVSPR